MSKKSKIYIIILSILTVILGVFVVMITIRENGEKNLVDYPSGSLSDSIFDSQNPTYVPNESLPTAKSFSHIPYTIDTVDKDGVVVDTGTIYSINDSQYLFYSEILKGDDTVSELAYQFAQVLEYNVSDDDVTYSVIKEETGYINGFAATFDIIKVSVPSDNIEKSAIIEAYTLVMPDQDDYEVLYDMSVCAVSTVEDTDLLSQCQQLAVIDIGTIQYSESLKKQMIEDLKKLEKNSDLQTTEEETEATEATEEIDEPETENIKAPTESVEDDDNNDDNIEEIVINNESTSSEDSNSGEASGDTDSVSLDDTNSKKMALHLKQEYNNLTLAVTWSNTSETPVIEVKSPDGSQTYSATNVSNGKCSVVIGQASAGVYVVRIGNYEACGEFSFELLDN